MAKSTFNKYPAGVSLLEIVISVGILMLVVPAISALVLSGVKGTTRNEQEFEAMALAQEGLEAARAIRDYSWNDLAVGTHGLNQANGYWTFSGSPETLGAYQRIVAVSSVDSNRKTVTSTVTWSPNKSVALTTRLTNWRANFGLEWVQTTFWDFLFAASLNDVVPIPVGWSGDGSVILFPGETSGEMRSSPFNTGSNYTTYQTISWVKSGDPEGTLRFQTKTSNSFSGLGSAVWLGPDGTQNSYYTVPGTQIVTQGGQRWIQYRVFFDAPPNKTPVLESVTIQYVP